MSTDISQLFTKDEVKELQVIFNDIPVLVKYKEMGWSMKNKVLSKSFDFQLSGKVVFDFDSYNKGMLYAMVTYIKFGDTEIPKNDLNEIFFDRLNPAFGALLEKIIPKAFSEVTANDFFTQEQKRS